MTFLRNLTDEVAHWNCVCSKRLLEVECQHYHLAAGAVNAVAEDALVDIRQFIDMLLVERVAEAVAELQLGYELEEGQVEIATHAHLDHRVEALEVHIVLILARQVDHRTDTADEVGPVVVETLSREFHVDGEGQVGVLHVLGRLAWLAGIVQVVEVTKREVLRAEVERRQKAQGQVLAQS